MKYQQNWIKRAFFGFFITMLFAQPLAAATPKSTEFQSWKKIQTAGGYCSVSFPKVPEYLQQKLPMKQDERELQYDVYVADHERKEIFMLLIAKYPGEVREEHAVKNLEHFLNTLIAQNPKNRLLFADLVDVQGFPAMDFFIRTDQVYFKGRAIQANNTLYLLALECEVPNYQEHHFDFFIKSFEFKK